MPLCTLVKIMGSNNMNASEYIYGSVYCYAEFEQLLAKITSCYKLMAVSGVQLANDENTIRDCLVLNYLKNDEVRKSIDIGPYNFEREVPEDTGNGRVDIKITSPNTFTQTAAYYTIECKRINSINTQGDSGLNCKYVMDGMTRYVDDKYASYYQTNAMIGFVVDKMDIDSNIGCINGHVSRLIGAKTTHDISPEAFISNFKFHYSSIHTKENGETLKLYHLMFDMTDNLVNIS